MDFLLCGLSALDKIWISPGSIQTALHKGHIIFQGHVIQNIQSNSVPVGDEGYSRLDSDSHMPRSVPMV